MSNSVVIENAILSYPNLFAPKCPKGSTTPKYSATFILPEGYDTTEIKAAIAQAKADKWAGNVPGELKSQIKKVKDGPYAGRICIATNAGEDYPPKVVDQNVNPMMDKSQIFAGCVVNAAVGFFGYNTGSNGVGCGLNMVQLVSNQNVTRLDGAQDAKDVFKKVAGATAPAATTPTAAATTSAAATADDLVEPSGDDFL